MTRTEFSDRAVPPFDESPSVILVRGDLDFFVEEAADKAAEILAKEGAEVLRFEDDAPPEAISDALLNRSLFSLRRVVRIDATRILGTESPASLLTGAVEGWEKGTAAGRREAFRFCRALLSSLDVPRGADPAETAEGIARRLRRRDDAAVLAEILRELPEDRGAPALLAPALRRLLELPNDGVVALLTATAPPSGAGLLVEISNKGLVLDASVGKGARASLARFARARAKEREVTLEADAIERLQVQTDGSPELFAAELKKVLNWAGRGGRVRGADVRSTVEDDSSEDVYQFFDAIGRRDAGDVLGRLERLFSGRGVKMGDRAVDSDEDYWPFYFFGLLTSELRRMLLVRSTLDQTGGRFEPGMSFAAFQDRLGPRLETPVAPFDRSPFEGKGGTVSPFLWYKVAQRSAGFRTQELARALCRAADVDVRLKSSGPPLETLSAFLGDLIAGR